MKILDKYILKRYLGSFFFIILLFSMLSVIVDFSEKVEDFMEEDGPTKYQVVMDYYVNFIPFINSLLFPLYNLIAVVFFTSRLANNSEFIAMIGNGVSFYRLLVPYLMGASLIAGIHFYGNHYLFPESNKTRVAFENKYIWKHNFDGPTENIHLLLSPYEEVYMQYFNRHDSMGHQLCWIHYDSSQLKRPTTLFARHIKLIEKPNKWRITGYRIREINGLDETLTVSDPQAYMDTVLSFGIEDLIKRDNLREAMTTNELIHYINREKARGSGATMRFEVERYRRSADPFTILVLTIIGLAIASRKMRGGMAWHLVIGILISGLYIFMTKFSTTFSTNGGLPPIIGVWIPNIIFSFLAFLMLLRAQK